MDISDEQWLEARIRVASRSIVVTGSPPVPMTHRAGHAATALALLAALALIVGIGVTVRGIAEPTTSAGNVGAGPLAVPADWAVRTSHGVILAAPSSWSGPMPIVDALPPRGPDQYLVLRRPDGSAALAIWIWTASSVRDLVSDRFVASSLQPFTMRQSQLAPGAVELVVDNLEWTAADGSHGKYQARHIFMQGPSGTVVHVSATGPFSESAYGSVSAAQALEEDQVAGSLKVLRDTTRQLSDRQVIAALDGTRKLSSAGQIGSTKAFTTTDGTRVYVTTYNDRPARLAAEAGVQSGLGLSVIDGPIASLGVGNALVIVQSRDPNITLSLLVAVESLVGN